MYVYPYYIAKLTVVQLLYPVIAWDKQSALSVKIHNIPSQFLFLVEYIIQMGKSFCWQLFVELMYCAISLEITDCYELMSHNIFSKDYWYCIRQKWLCRECKCQKGHTSFSEFSLCAWVRSFAVIMKFSHLVI